MDGLLKRSGIKRIRNQHIGVGSLAKGVAHDGSHARIRNDNQTGFARQIEALGRPGDLAIAITTSGRSTNIVHGLETARDMGLGAAALAGGDGGAVRTLADPCLVVPSRVTARVQEMHITLGQMLCLAIERELGLTPA